MYIYFNLENGREDKNGGRQKTFGLIINKR